MSKQRKIIIQIVLTTLKFILQGSTDMITTCVCEDENVNELNLKTPSTLENDTFSNFTIKSFNETFNIPEIVRFKSFVLFKLLS